MKRSIKIVTLCVFAIMFVTGGAYFILLRTYLNGDQEETATEIIVTPEYSRNMRSAGFPITISRAFEASSYGGWHGDGASLTIYRYDPAESSALLSALKTRNPGYIWTETGAEYTTYGDLKDLLPKDF